MKSEEADDENSNIDVCYFWIFGIEKYLINSYNLIDADILKKISAVIHKIFLLENDANYNDDMKYYWEINIMM